MVLAFIQASALAVTLGASGLAYEPGTSFFISAVFSVVAGTIFLMWLGELISERGIGNGISIIIATSILTGIPGAIGQALEQARQGDLNILLLLGIGVLAMLVIAVGNKDADKTCQRTSKGAWQRADHGAALLLCVCVYCMDYAHPG